MERKKRHTQRERKKCQKIHLKINGLYYFYIEKLLRSNLLYVHENFLCALIFSHLSSSSYRLYQGKERNLPLFCVSSSPLRAAFNRINGLFMFFPSHPSLIHNNLNFFFALHLIMRSHIIYTHTPETCLSNHTRVNFISF